jgi:hypothetical protein
MQIVLKNGTVLATHEDHQNVANLYSGCEIRFTAIRCQPGDPDPRTDAEKNSEYRDQRQVTYPSLTDQLDMIYWDQVNGTTTWRDAVAAIKAQYPKV